MDPTAVRAAYPGARFVARARLIDGADGATPEVWGILVRIADAGDRDQRSVVTDEGRSFVAHLATTNATAGAPSDILAAARYWELPPAYVQRLRAAATAAGARVDADEDA
jgi:hypothetical protein